MGLSQMCEKIIAVTTVAVRQAELFTTRVKALGHENQHLHPANAPNREYPCEGENHIGELVVCATDLTRRTMDVLLAQCEQPKESLRASASGSKCRRKQSALGMRSLFSSGEP